MSNWKMEETEQIRLKYSNKLKKKKNNSSRITAVTLLLLLDFPELNFFSVCLVWISMRSSSPASAFSRLFWLCFLVPVGATLLTTSFGLGPFFFPGGRPEFWEAVRGALESGEPGNGGPVRPMFCWKMSCQRICAHFSWSVQKNLTTDLKSYQPIITYLNQSNFLGKVFHKCLSIDGFWNFYFMFA